MLPRTVFRIFMFFYKHTTTPWLDFSGLNIVVKFSHSPSLLVFQSSFCLISTFSHFTFFSLSVSSSHFLTLSFPVSFLPFPFSHSPFHRFIVSALRLIFPFSHPLISGLRSPFSFLPLSISPFHCLSSPSHLPIFSPSRFPVSFLPFLFSHSPFHPLISVPVFPSPCSLLSAPCSLPHALRPLLFLCFALSFT